MSQGAGPAGTTEFREYQWAYSIMDSSRVSTCLISMLLIVYGSFRSLNMEQEAREREQKKRQSDSLNNLITGEPVSVEQSMHFADKNYRILLIFRFLFPSNYVSQANLQPLTQCTHYVYHLEHRYHF